MAICLFQKYQTIISQSNNSIEITIYICRTTFKTSFTSKFIGTWLIYRILLFIYKYNQFDQPKNQDLQKNFEIDDYVTPHLGLPT